MLILSRQRDEQFIITVPPSDKPTVIVHTTAEIRGDKVRHGWEAAKEVQIDRREVAESKARERRVYAAVRPAGVNPGSEFRH